jgi:hypothetical protein
MPKSGRKLYIILITACAAGYIWLGFNLTLHSGESGLTAEVCLIKHTTNIPCPSCGSTRSILALLHGDFMDSLFWNPLGLIVMLIMVIVPVLIIHDLLFRKDVLPKLYAKTEATFRKRKFAIPALVLILINWIWNIFKGL